MKKKYLNSGGLASSAKVRTKAANSLE